MSLSVKNMLGGGGAIKVLNGVLEQYYAYSDTINAVSFVEFLTDNVVSAQCKGTDTSGYAYTRGCVLSDNKVLMCSWNSSSNNIYLVVATFDNSSISFGTVCVADYTNNMAYDIEVQKLSDTTALLGYSTGSSGYYRMYVVTINNTTITVGAQYETEGYINDYDCSVEPNRICVLNSTKALITYIRNTSSSSYDGTRYTCARVCTISGTTITFGTELVIASKGSYSTYDQYHYAQYNALVSSTQVLSCMDFYDGSNYNKYFYLLSISGTTVTIASKSTTTTITVPARGNLFKRITASKFLLIYFKVKEAPYARIITLSGTTISIGNETAIKYNWASNSQIALLIYDTTTAYLYTCYSSGGRINRTPIYISGTTITSGNAAAVGDTVLNRPYFAARAGDLEIVVGRELMSIMLIRPGTYLKSSESKIEGLLISKATSNSKGKVYKLG